MKDYILTKEEKRFVEKNFEEMEYMYSYSMDYLALPRIGEMYKLENLCYESTVPLTTGIVLELAIDENDSFWLGVYAEGKIHMAMACPETEKAIARVLSRVNENPEEWLPNESNNEDFNCLKIFRVKPFLLEIESGIITLVRPFNAALAEEALALTKRMISNGYLEFTDANGEEIA